MWLVARSSTIHLNGALKTTSIGCTKLVHPSGISAVVVLQSLVNKSSINGIFSDQDKEELDPPRVISSAV